MPPSSNRYALLLLALLVLIFLGYAYHKNPVGCWKVFYAVDELVISLLPGHHATSEDKTTSIAKKTALEPTPTLVPPSAPVTTSAPASASAPEPVHSLVPLTADEAQLLTPAPTNAAPVAATQPAIKPWAPPEIIPAQENWTWTTTDGKTYDNVVVDKIDPDTVSITHSHGVAQIPTATLPPDIQKKLNYDPALVAAALAETKREKDHPFYHFAELSDAQAAARNLHLPLAWMNGDSYYARPDQVNEPDNNAVYTALALDYLDKHAIVIFMVGNDDLAALPALIRDQLFTMDDGPMPGGHHFKPPKIVLTDVEITKVYGRVANVQFKADGAKPLLNLLNSIK